MKFHKDSQGRYMPIIVRGDPSKPRAKARFSVGSPVNSREAGQQFNFGKLDEALLLKHFPHFLSYLHSFSSFFRFKAYLFKNSTFTSLTDLPTLPSGQLKGTCTVLYRHCRAVLFINKSFSDIIAHSICCLTLCIG